MNINDNAATSKVVNASPGDTEHQFPLDLWVKGRDPNNPKLDIFEWEMLGENFARLIQKVLFEVKPASDIIFMLSQHSLKATHTASDGGFTISAEAAVTSFVPIGSDDIFFSIGRRQAEKAKAAFSRWPVLTCRYEKNKAVLWVASKDCRVPLIAKPILDIERPPELTVFTQLDATQLRSSCSTACLFHKRREGRLTARRDLIIKDGYAVHWYPYAAARYPIAHSSEFAIPGELIPNFLQLAARCRGTITVSESSCAIFASAENQIAASWRKSKAANTVPQFSEPANAAVTLDTIRMLIAVSILAAFTENVRLTYAHDDNRRFLLLTADFKGLPLTARIPFSSTDARNFDCIVKTKDLALACCRLISNEHFSLKFTERFALIEGPGHEAGGQMILWRFQPA